MSKMESQLRLDLSCRLDDLLSLGSSPCLWVPVVRMARYGAKWREMARFDTTGEDDKTNPSGPGDGWLAPAKYWPGLQLRDRAANG